ncbi:MAG: putative metal-binding motif-containing protein [Sandaracinus sp.]
MKRWLGCAAVGAAMAAGCGQSTTPAATDAAMVGDGGATSDAGDCPDRDGDGARDHACGGTDCDDSTPVRSPTQSEICDTQGVDEDCDPSTFGARDQDGDGHVDAQCCNGAVCGDDCNDVGPRTYAGATEQCDDADNDCDGTVDEDAVASRPEVCNAMDDDCDSLVDEDVLQTFYVDADGDLFGDGTMPVMACAPGAALAVAGTDCDDGTPAIHPGAAEVCDTIDNDCDGVVDPGCSCTTGATRPCEALGRCASGTQTCLGGSYGACSIQPVAETCNGLDDDCNGVTDEGLVCP